MSKQLSVETMVCSAYQRSLEECQSALEIWNIAPRFVGLVWSERNLLRLQAKFARAYTVLQNHVHNCLRCQIVPRVERCDSENNSATYTFEATPLLVKSQDWGRGQSPEYPWEILTASAAKFALISREVNDHIKVSCRSCCV
jgi:hypothetical protein